jgi:transcriptional regulator with XRE-family HTH domain
MKLNDWIREQRKKKNFTVTQLANRARISHAQVSRIENDKSKISLVTLARLLYALDISFSSIFTNEEIQVGLPNLNVFDNIKAINRGNSFEYPCINFNDIELLDKKEIIASGKIKEITILLLQQFIQKFDASFDKKTLKSFAEIYYRGLGGPPFGLARLPAGFTPSTMPEVEELTSPPKFSEHLRQIYLSGGVLIFLDIGMYIYNVRLSQNLSLRELGKMVGISHQGIKFIETRTAEKLIFDDLVRLDQSLDLGGDLITLAWRASEIYTGAFRVRSISDNNLHPFSPPEIFEIERLIITSRLFQYFLPGDVSWLEWFRKISLSGIPIDG